MHIVSPVITADTFKHKNTPLTKTNNMNKTNEQVIIGFSMGAAG